MTLLVEGVAAATTLIKAIRTHGHLAANLDPLGSEPVGDPALEAELLEPPLTPELQARIPASVLRVGVEGETLADVLPKLREIYCGTIAYEIEHISDHQERVWLQHAIESGRYREPLTADERRSLLERLTEVEGFEHYLKRAFLGQKQFSIEGLDVMVPMLDEAVELGVECGRARGRDRHGAPRAAQRPRTHHRSTVRGAAARVRGRAHDRGDRRDARKGRAATSSTTSEPSAVARRRPATRRCSSPRTRATSRPSILSSRASREPSRPIARPAWAPMTQRWRCRS